MRAGGVLSLAATIVFCLPSLIGGVVLLTNRVLHRHLEHWAQNPPASLELGIFIGGPLVAIATAIALVVAFSRRASPQMKFAHLIVVGLGVIAAISLMLHFPG